MFPPGSGGPSELPWGGEYGALPTTTCAQQGTVMTLTSPWEL